MLFFISRATTSGHREGQIGKGREEFTGRKTSPPLNPFVRPSKEDIERFRAKYEYDVLFFFYFIFLVICL